MKTIVHVLHEGRTFCGFGGSQFPGEWPPGHKWTWPHDEKSVTCEECLKELRERIGPQVEFIKRKDVSARLMKKWKEAIYLAKEVGLSYRIPDWDTLRNYEMEGILREQFGGNWIIAEWCPFDGIFCRYKDVASRYDLKEARDNIAAVDDRDLNKDYLFGLIDKELEKRPSTLGDKQYWGRGYKE